MSVLSSHFSTSRANGDADKQGGNAPNTVGQWKKHLELEVDLVERAVALKEWAVQVGAAMQVINYADLLWRPEAATGALDRLLPCIAKHGFDASWRPTLGEHD